MELSLNKSLNRVLNPLEKNELETEKNIIMSEIGRVKCELTSAYNNFNYVSDFLLVDYYTYQIKSFEVRYEYLIKLAKEIGLSSI